MNQFDKKFDRSVTGTRKWSPVLLSEKIPDKSDIIAMDLADIDFECAPSIKEALVQRALQPDYSYTFIPDEFYDAVIRWNKEHFDLSIEKEWIRLTFGTISALHNIVQALTDVGDSIMIHTPAYAPFSEAVLNNKRKLICNDLKINQNRYYIDFEKMEKQIAENKVKLFILCNPQNPSGRIWTKDELISIAKLCQKYNVLIVSDEIHRDIVFQEGDFHSLWKACSEIMNQSIMCVSPNKAFNLGGLKTSYIVIPNPSIKQKVYERLSANYVTSPHVFAVPAIVAAYNNEFSWLRGMVEYIAENQRVVIEFIQEKMPLFIAMEAESSFLTWIYVGDVFDCESKIKDYFDEAGLTIVLGSYFVSNGEGFVRLNIGMQREKVLEALERMKKLYDEILSMR